MTRAVVLTVLCMSLAADRAAAEPAHDAPAMTAEARAHWERGLAAHAAHRYDAASAEFAACYRLSQRRECLFAWAQAARLGGDCAAAIGLYRQYLEADVSPRQADAARGQIAVCEAAIAVHPESPGISIDVHARAEAPPASPPTAAVPAPAAPSPATAPERPASPHQPPWYRDVWGDALIGTGIAGLAAGSLLYLAARGDAAAEAPTYGGYADLFTRAQRTRTWAVVTAGTGAALIAAGIVHLALRDGATAQIGLDASTASLGVHYAGAF